MTPRAMDDPLATEADTLRRNAFERPDHPAILFGETQLTYAAMDDHASRVANGLIALGVARQDRVALLGKNSANFFEAVFGIAKAGAIALPVNWRLATPEIAHIIGDSGARILFAGEDFLPEVERLAARGITFDRVIVLDGAAAAADYEPWRDAQPPADPQRPVMPEDIFLLLYTSGTTGHPKGVQISHRASMLMRRLEVSTGGAWADWDERDVAIVAMPNFHVSGLSWALQWLARGATCLVQVQVDPAAMLEGIERHRVTQIFAVPTVMDMMLGDPSCTTRDLSSLRLIHYGGAPITPALLRRCIAAFDAAFVQYYGMTETNGVVSVLQPHEHNIREPSLLKSVGRPYPFLSLRIFDEAGRDVGPGVVGEICVRTSCLMSGYWHRPDATAAAMWGDYYRTGDAGHLSADGYLFIVDRLKDMIVSGGENIYPVEVERALAEHPGVAAVSVIGVPDPHWGEAVKAVVIANDPSLDEPALLAFLDGRIARYKRPKSIAFVDTLPMNASGKILKRELRALHVEGQTI